MPGKELENAFLKRKPYFGIYNKKSGRSVLFEGEEDPACKCDVMAGIVGTWEKGFILEADYSKISKVLEKLDPKRAKCLNPKLFYAVDKLEMTSNPVLVLIEFVL